MNVRICEKWNVGFTKKEEEERNGIRAWNVLRGYGHISRASYRFYDSGSFLKQSVAVH